MGIADRPNRVFALADDLTGALEAGAAFAQTGIRTQVSLRAAPQITPALVIDTETRHLPPAEASRRVRELTRRHPARLIYLKTDSTLRGNIGAELTAVSDIAPVLYAPAYPRMGRTVTKGRLYVDRAPVEQSEFARDALNPVRDGYIPRVIGAACECIAGAPPPHANAGIFICDGETDADIAAAAEFVLGAERQWIAAGPAALAKALAERIDLPRSPSLPRIAGRGAVLVNGSRHGRSLQQVERAVDDGWLRIDAGEPNTPPWSILNTEIAGSELGRAAQVGEMVAALIRRQPPDALIVFGGDTAFGILRAMGSPPLEPIAELLPGVPVSRIPGGPLLITKAGGFGPPDLARRIRDILTRAG